MTAVQPDLLRSVEDFLYREARYMDEHRFDDWLNLWSEECTYWVPCNDEGSDPSTHVSIIFDNRSQLEDRIWRLKGKHAHAQRPMSRLARVISNIEIGNTENDEMIVHSTFMLGEIRKDEKTLWFGRTLHRLIPSDGGFRIKTKKVYVIANDSPLSNLTFLI
jgi:3-phenylpropionate/cinnamic acid dioxygenase small subunit